MRLMVAAVPAGANQPTATAEDQNRLTHKISDTPA